MAELPKYYDPRAAFWKRHFELAADYETYLRQSDPAKAAKWANLAEKIPPVSPEQQERVRGHGRKMNLLVSSSVWCGDCVRQGPMLQRIAQACGPEVAVRFIDREDSGELRDELRILGGSRVPQVVFLSEDFFEIGRFGDRLLTVYRAKARRELGPACDPGIVAPPADELAAELEEWVAIFERMLLLLRLAPALRERYGD